MQEQAKSKNLRPRPPIVVVMGHVDHGKTTLLDYIRKTSVAAKEAGGITQSIGAYEIWHTPAQINADETRINADKISINQRSNQRESAPAEGSSASLTAGRKITFIDTPGHEAFSKMRSRGADVADLAILVVAADEGVKPQTKEAIAILRDAEIPFIVAITKIDKPGADVNKVKNELTAAGVLLEGFGGNVSFHGVSSKTGEGVNDLIDLILLAADLEGLTFDARAPVSGYVLEARRDARRGIEANMVVKNGILAPGKEIYTATAGGKVKILEDFMGRPADALEPSAPARVIGFEKLPQVGEIFAEEQTLAKVAQALAHGDEKEKPNPKSGKAVLNLILKASDGGSLEALSEIVGAMGSEDKPLFVIGELVGDITDGDVKTAIATKSVIIGFKNKIEKGARNLAQAHDTKIITSDIVYDLVKAVQDFLSERGLPKTAGELEVLAVFSQTKPDKQLVGGRVSSGMFKAKAAFEVLRKDGDQEKTEGSGRILSLKEKKTPLTQAEAGKEIGLLVNSSVLIKVGDKLVIRK